MSPTLTRTLRKPAAPPPRSGLTLPFSAQPVPRSGAVVLRWLPSLDEYLIVARELRLPVRVSIAKEDGVAYVALNKPTGIVGSGSSVALAVRDLVEAMGEHLDVLRSEGTLSPDLADQLRYLTEHLHSRR
jgi:predicted RNase H-like HicB family nuclease